MTQIGISPRLLHPQSGARGVFTKLLHYVEDGIAQWLQSREALLFVLPLSERAADYAQALDGLVLQGGADISPLVYGEEAQKPEWAGDPMRDAYEIALVQAFTVASKPVLGICRGAQLINVALGGSLHQDVRRIAATTTTSTRTRCVSSPARGSRASTARPGRDAWCRSITRRSSASRPGCAWRRAPRTMA